REAGSDGREPSGGRGLHRGCGQRDRERALAGRTCGDGRPASLAARRAGRDPVAGGRAGPGGAPRFRRARKGRTMNTELFIRRPVMTTLIMAGIVVFGIMAYRFLPASDLPNVDFPTIQVTASLPGASPDTMASAVATPLEKQFSTIAGVDSMTSTSAQGLTQITIQFALDRNIDA